MNPQFGIPVESMGPKYGEVDLNAKVIDTGSIHELERIIADAGGVVSCEIKEDGNRAQPHVNNGLVRVFARSTEFEARCLPEIVDALQSLKLKHTILDAELRGVGGRFAGFKAVGKRVRYAGRISDKSINQYLQGDTLNDYPLELVVFDVLMHNNKSCLDLPYSERRKIVEDIARHNIIQPTIKYEFSQASDIITLFRQKVLHEKLEGLVLKQPNLQYIPGDKNNWIKLKKFEPIDLVVVGMLKNTRKDVSAEYGQAMVATYSSDADIYQTIGVVSLLKKNPVTDNLFTQDISERISELFDTKPINVEYGKSLPDVYVTPENSVVLEIGAMNFDYGSNNFACRLAGEKSYSLRIAHVRIIREDKAPRQATTTEQIAKLHKMQK